MPFPAGMTLVEVTCGFDDLPDGGTPGRVRFESGGPFVGAVDGRIIRPVTETVELVDETGDGTIELPATNDPDWTPVDRPYVVTCSINGTVFRGTMLLDYQTPTVQFTDVFQLDGAAEAGVTYATLAQLTAGLATKQDAGDYLVAGEDLEIADVNGLTAALAGKAATVHTHTIAQVDDLQTQLDDKQVAGTYLVPADIAGLVSYETMTESIATHSAAVDPHGDRAYASGLVTPKLTASYVDVSTCPVSGTWTTGSTVMTRSGWWRCTAGGTPGTWAPLGFHPALEAGYAAWNGNPGAEVQGGTIIATGGRSHIIRFRALGPAISTLHMHATTVAAGVTNAWCTLHDDAGLILNANAKSNANQNVAFQTGGMKTFTMLASQNVTPGAYYKARVWFTTGTALPTLSRMCSSGSDIVNPGVTGTAASTAYGWSTADTGLTDLASAPDQIGLLTANGTAYWMGAKA
jgi:hypothetical protein